MSQRVSIDFDRFRKPATSVMAKRADLNKRRIMTAAAFKLPPPSPNKFKLARRYEPGYVTRLSGGKMSDELSTVPQSMDNSQQDPYFSA